MISLLFEFADKIRWHWDGWWIPHVVVAVFCAGLRIGGQGPGGIVAFLLAGAWCALVLCSEFFDEIAPWTELLHELGAWTWGLHIAASALPLVAVVATHLLLRRRITMPAPAH